MIYVCACDFNILKLSGIIDWSQKNIRLPFFPLLRKSYRRLGTTAAHSYYIHRTTIGILYDICSTAVCFHGSRWALTTDRTISNCFLKPVTGDSSGWWGPTYFSRLLFDRLVELHLCAGGVRIQETQRCSGSGGKTAKKTAPSASAEPFHCSHSVDWTWVLIGVNPQTVGTRVGFQLNSVSSW